MLSEEILSELYSSVESGCKKKKLFDLAFELDDAVSFFDYFPDDYFLIILKIIEDPVMYEIKGLSEFIVILNLNLGRLSSQQIEQLCCAFVKNIDRHNDVSMVDAMFDFMGHHCKGDVLLDSLSKILNINSEKYGGPIYDCVRIALLNKNLDDSEARKFLIRNSLAKE